MRRSPQTQNFSWSWGNTTKQDKWLFFFFLQLYFKMSGSNDDQSAILLTEDVMLCLVCPVGRSQILEQQVYTSWFYNLPYPFTCILLDCFSDCRQIWAVPVQPSRLAVPMLWGKWEPCCRGLIHFNKQRVCECWEASALPSIIDVIRKQFI